MAYISLIEGDKMKNKIRYQQTLINGLMQHQELQQNAFSEIIERQQAMIIRLQDQQAAQQECIDMMLQQLEQTESEHDHRARKKRNTSYDPSSPSMTIEETHRSPLTESRSGSILEWDKPLYVQETEEEPYQQTNNRPDTKETFELVQLDDLGSKSNNETCKGNFLPPKYDCGLIPRLSDVYETLDTFPNQIPYECMKSPNLVVGMSQRGDNIEGSSKSRITLIEETPQVIDEAAHDDHTDTLQRNEVVITEAQQSYTLQYFDTIRLLVGSDNLNSIMLTIRDCASNLVGQLSIRFNLSFDIPWEQLTDTVRQYGVNAFEAEMLERHIPITQCAEQWIAKESMQHEWDLFYKGYTLGLSGDGHQTTEESQTLPQENKPTMKRRVGRPKGAKNKNKRSTIEPRVKKHIGRPKGAKNKIKPPQGKQSIIKRRTGGPRGVKSETKRL